MRVPRFLCPSLRNGDCPDFRPAVLSAALLSGGDSRPGIVRSGNNGRRIRGHSDRPLAGRAGGMPRRGVDRRSGEVRGVGKRGSRSLNCFRPVSPENVRGWRMDTALSEPIRQTRLRSATVVPGRRAGTERKPPFLFRAVRGSTELAGGSLPAAPAGIAANIVMGTDKCRRDDIMSSRLQIVGPGPDGREPSSSARIAVRSKCRGSRSAACPRAPSRRPPRLFSCPVAPGRSECRSTACPL